MINTLRSRYYQLRERVKEQFALPAGTSGERVSTSLCKFLQSRAEIDACTAFLSRNGYTSHTITCKAWDLACILPELGPGNFLDMGSSDSYILKNLVRKKIPGARYGIDLRAPNVPVRGVRYLLGDLMDTGLPNGFFQNITCLSVIEHQVDFSRFACEAARLLAPGGRLFVTFDYWEPKTVLSVRLYGLEWTEQFIAELFRRGLRLIQDMDWKLGEAVIREGYYSPHPSVSYTFGLVVFEKS